MKNRLNLIIVAILTMGLFITAEVRAQDAAPPPPPPDAQAQPQDLAQEQAPEEPQGPPEGQPQGAAPAQGQEPTEVGRLSVIQGQASTMHSDGTEWAAGTVNTPIMPGDKVATGDRSRAELQLDPTNVLRLNQQTQAQVADLQANKIQIQLASGLVDYSALTGSQADVEIDTPNMGVHILAPGLYRVQVDSDSDTHVTVEHGEAEVLTNQGSTKVEAGQTINIRGTDNPEYKVDAAASPDDFDQWARERDQHMQAPPPQQQRAEVRAGSAAAARASLHRVDRSG